MSFDSATTCGMPSPSIAPSEGASGPQTAPFEKVASQPSGRRRAKPRGPPRPRPARRPLSEPAAGKPAAWGPLFGGLQPPPDVRRPAKDEARGVGVPSGPPFPRPPQAPPVSSEAAAEQPVFVDAEGQAYVDGD